MRHRRIECFDRVLPHATTAVVAHVGTETFGGIFAWHRQPVGMHDIAIDVAQPQMPLGRRQRRLDQRVRAIAIG